ncbi:phage holin family protein [Amedibacillus sp. YH-ame6]
MKMEFIIDSINTNPVVLVVALWIVLDTIFGVLRAFKQHGFNSSFGIDGGIRKIGMIFGILFLLIADHIVHINLAFMIPVDWLKIFDLEKIGLTEFFGILFILYETISILKNMILVGVPAPKWIKDWLENFLNTMTNEMPEILKGKEDK